MILGVLATTREVQKSKKAKKAAGEEKLFS